MALITIILAHKKLVRALRDAHISVFGKCVLVQYM